MSKIRQASFIFFFFWIGSAQAGPLIYGLFDCERVLRGSSPTAVLLEQSDRFVADVRARVVQSTDPRFVSMPEFRPTLLEMKSILAGIRRVPFLKSREIAERLEARLTEIDGQGIPYKSFVMAAYEFTALVGYDHYLKSPAEFFFSRFRHDAFRTFFNRDDRRRDLNELIDLFPDLILSPAFEEDFPIGNLTAIGALNPSWTRAVAILGMMRPGLLKGAKKVDGQLYRVKDAKIYFNHDITHALVLAKSLLADKNLPFEKRREIQDWLGAYLLAFEARFSEKQAHYLHTVLLQQIHENGLHAQTLPNRFRGVHLRHDMSFVTDRIRSDFFGNRDELAEFGDSVALELVDWIEDYVQRHPLPMVHVD